MARFTCNFISYTLSRAVDITVVVPTPTIPDSMMAAQQGTKLSHTPEHPYPVLYLLHGFGNNHATWAGYARVELFAEEHQIAIVMLSAENKAYINQPNGGDRHYDFLAKELPDFVGGMFPISKRPEDTYIAGLSMGGYGTLVHGLSQPERFAAVCPLSAAVSMRRDGDSDVSLDYDPATLAERIAKNGGKFPKFYIACGKQDFLYDANVAFRDRLRSLGADVTWDETEEHGHEWRFWDLELERILEWLPRTDFYAGKKRKV